LSHAVYDFILCLLLCSLITIIVKVNDLLIRNTKIYVEIIILDCLRYSY
jgi:hypothetical protein